MRRKHHWSRMKNLAKFNKDRQIKKSSATSNSKGYPYTAVQDLGLLNFIHSHKIHLLKIHRLQTLAKKITPLHEQVNWKSNFPSARSVLQRLSKLVKDHQNQQEIEWSSACRTDQIRKLLSLIVKEQNELEIERNTVIKVKKKRGRKSKKELLQKKEEERQKLKKKQKQVQAQKEQQKQHQQDSQHQQIPKQSLHKQSQVPQQLCLKISQHQQHSDNQKDDSHSNHDENFSQGYTENEQDSQHANYRSFYVDDNGNTANDDEFDCEEDGDGGDDDDDVDIDDENNDNIEVDDDEDVDDDDDVDDDEDDGDCDNYDDDYDDDDEDDEDDEEDDEIEDDDDNGDDDIDVDQNRCRFQNHCRNHNPQTYHRLASNKYFADVEDNESDDEDFGYSELVNHTTNRRNCQKYFTANETTNNKRSYRSIHNGDIANDDDDSFYFNQRHVNYNESNRNNILTVKEIEGKTDVNLGYSKKNNCHHKHKRDNNNQKTERRIVINKYNDANSCMGGKEQREKLSCMTRYEDETTNSYPESVKRNRVVEEEEDNFDGNDNNLRNDVDNDSYRNNLFPPEDSLYQTTMTEQRDQDEETGEFRENNFEGRGGSSAGDIDEANEAEIDIREATRGSMAGPSVKRNVNFKGANPVYESDNIKYTNESRLAMNRDRNISLSSSSSLLKRGKTAMRIPSTITKSIGERSRKNTSLNQFYNDPKSSSPSGSQSSKQQRRRQHVHVSKSHKTKPKGPSQAGGMKQVGEDEDLQTERNLELEAEEKQFKLKSERASLSLSCSSSLRIEELKLELEIRKKEFEIAREERLAYEARVKQFEVYGRILQTSHDRHLNHDVVLDEQDRKRSK